MSKQSLNANSEDAQVVTCLTNYKQEAESACTDRMLQNLENFDTYHHRQDFTHKIKGQSKEFLPKQFMAVEQITNFVQQGLSDIGSDWYSAAISEGVENPKILAEDIKMLLDRQLQKADFYTAIGDGLKCGLLGSLIIAKIHGKWVEKPRFTTKEAVISKDGEAVKIKKLMKVKDKAWQLCIDVISPKDFRPDPTGRGLYLLHDIEMDMHEIRRQVKSAENPEGIYDKDAVDLLAGDMQNLDKDEKASRESGQNIATSSFRRRVSVTECWGTILDENGDILHENVVCALANGKFLIRKPEKNPFWHGQHPFVVTPLVRVPHSVWHKALMDGPTKFNKALNEIYNLTLDNGIMSVFGIKQLRTDWLEDATVVDDGVKPGQTLEVNAQCPPGQKVLERVDTASMSPEAIQVFQLTNAEFQQSSMTNDLRLGVLPQRQVKATEVVESSQSITGMLNGMAKFLENQFVQPVLHKSWMTISQHIEDFDDVEVQKLLGPQKSSSIKAMSREERFAETVNGLTFKVFGLTATLNKMKDFRRITALMQTIAGSEVLVEEFAKKYDFGKLLTEIMKSLDINPEQIKLDEGTQDNKGNGQQVQPNLPGGGGPNMMSQVPQVASDKSGPGPESPSSIPQPKFPPSRATGALKQ